MKYFAGYLPFVFFITAVIAQQNQANITRVCPINLALVVDRSGSIGKDPPYGSRASWQSVKTALSDLVAGLSIGPDDAHVGVVGFSDVAEYEFGMNELNKSRMISHLNNLPYDFVYGGRTNTNAGLQMANQRLFTRDVMSREGAANVLLLFTDGKATPSLNAELPGTVQVIKDRGIRIIGVGMTDQINEAELAYIVSDPATDLITIAQFSKLQQNLRNITQAVCTVPIIPTCDAPSQSYSDCGGCQATCEDPEPACAEGCHKGCFCPPDNPVLIEDSGGARCGVLAYCNIDPCRIDLVLVVDESGSIAKDSLDAGGPDYWPVMRDFIAELLQRLQVSRLGTRVGLVMFGTTARVIFAMNELTDKQDMVNAVMDVQCRCYNGSKTNTSGALRLARETLLSPSGGERGGVHDVVLLITDGDVNVDGHLLSTEASKKEEEPVTGCSSKKANILKERAQLIVVGVSPAVNRDRLLGIVTNENRDYFEVEQFDRLSDIIDGLLDQTCQRFSCSPPINIEHAVAFNAYSIKERVEVWRGDTLGFELTYTNQGGHYSAASGIFMCPCKGMYFFHHAVTGIEDGIGTAIIKSGLLVSPMALISAHGAMATSSVIMCLRGERVSVEVVVVGEERTVRCSHAAMSLCSFEGFLIYTLP